MTCMKQEFCIHEKYCQRHIGQNFDSCILFSRNSKPMTNEEYLKSLDTEQLAEWINHVSDFCEICEKHCDNDTGMQCNGDFKERWVEWLKEKHDGNMG